LLIGLSVYVTVQVLRSIWWVITEGRRSRRSAMTSHHWLPLADDSTTLSMSKGWFCYASLPSIGPTSSKQSDFTSTVQHAVASHASRASRTAPFRFWCVSRFVAFLPDVSAGDPHPWTPAPRPAHWKSLWVSVRRMWDIHRFKDRIRTRRCRTGDSL